ncbi:MAG: hypothetical protein JNN19_09235, partial [Bacteroidia bacterium]|nr:hypothetical protein [Bacteroidia bacterium]
MNRLHHTFLCFFGLACLAASATRPYFQQALTYRIQVKLDDREHMLRGQVAIDYTNRS